MKRESRNAVLTRHAVFRAAVALNDLFSEKAVALDGVVIPFAAAHLILTEANHADFRV